MADSLQTINEIDNVELAHSVECDILDLSKHIQVNKSSLTILNQNICSIYANFDNFLLSLPNLKFEADVLIFTECRLNVNKPLPHLNNYQSYSTENLLNQNDGVVMYVKHTIKHKVKEIKLVHASCLQLIFQNSIILGIYRSPSNINAKGFIDSLSSLLSTFSAKANIIITGDININIAVNEKERPREYENRVYYLHVLSLYGILSGHTLPTRLNSCLDHVMLRINKKHLSADIAVLHTTITDHFTIFVCLANLKNKINNEIIKTRTKIDYVKMNNHIQEKKLTELLLYNDANLVTDLLIHNLKECINLSTVIINVPKNKRTLKPWISPGILRCINHRNKLQKNLRCDPFNEILKITYIRYRNFCNNLIKKLKRKYEKGLLEKSINNNKLLWKNIQNITHTNTNKNKNNNSELLNLKSSPLESTNFINNYFSNIGKELALKFTSNSPTSANIGKESLSQSNSFVLLDTDQHEIDSILMNLKSDSAPGWDNISAKLLKNIRQYVVPILTHISNLCIKQGVFPNSLKQSIIIPIHKCGDTDDINNYRPISVLTAISKVLEKLLNSRLTNYLNKYNLLSPSQYGFQQGKSTEDAVTALTSLIVDQMDQGKKSIAVFLDLKKAFDTVSIPILINKLERIGIRGLPLNLFIDYLTNRKQKVRVGDCISQNKNVTCGVPQGSVLGPTLFLIYINDLCNLCISDAKIFAYADDTAVVFSGTSWNSAFRSTEIGMCGVGEWLHVNQLTLNTSKTNYICFGIRNNIQTKEDLSIKIHNCNSLSNTKCDCPVINRVRYTKYLGVIVDEKLSWYPQLEQVTNRVRKLIWIFKSLRYISPTKLRLSSGKSLINNIYIALAQSILIYCISVWGGAVKTKFVIVERAQRALLKVIYFKTIRFPSEALYNECDLLSVRKLYILHSILKTHKTIERNKESIGNSRRTKNVVLLPNVKTKFASIQFNWRSAFIYNKINKELNIYNKSNYDCKIIITSWLKKSTYDNIEVFLRNVT